MDSVFLDTGAFIAIMAARDPNHPSAKALYSHLVKRRALLVVTNHVIDETCTWLLRDRTAGHAGAAAFGRFIRANSQPMDAADSASGKPMRVVHSSPSDEQRAWEMFETCDTAGFSFTDCVSFAVMERLGISRAFTYDAHFDMLGFVRVTG